MQGIIYILNNPAFPSLIKIGMTTREDIKSRMAELYSTGVPLPYECVYAAKVENIDAVEKALHIAFGPNRINPKREFFEIDSMQAIAIIKLMAIEDVTPNVAREAEVVDVIEREAGEEYARKKRPRFNFAEMGIPIGSELICVSTGESASVVDERRVVFRGNMTLLTTATKEALETNSQIAPGYYWTFNGRKLREIYNETYE